MRISLFSQNLAGTKEVKFDLTDFIEKAPSENPRNIRGDVTRRRS